MLIGLCVASCSPKQPSATLAEESAESLVVGRKSPTPFKDEPAAHAIYNRMIKAMRNAISLSYVSHYAWHTNGKGGDCTYRVWLKKPNCFHVEAESAAHEMSGVIVGDGEKLWVYWPLGRPRFLFDTDTEAYEKTRLHTYLTSPAPLGRHQIYHQMRLLSYNLFPILCPSTTFFGCNDWPKPVVDAMGSLAPERIGTEDCDKIELSLLNHQQSWCLWLSRSDYLPRKLTSIIRASHDIVLDEQWSSVTLDAELPGAVFVWKPPEGWKEWKVPETTPLKPGTRVPDFALASADGGKIRLSDYHGKVVWLCFWDVACPACRMELPYLQELYSQYKGKGLIILGFNPIDNRQIALDLLRKKGYTFPNILDSSEAALRVCDQDYRGNGPMPLNYIIDRDGQVVDSWFGYDDHTDRQAIAVLKKLGIDSPGSEER
jgi:peroxiredoxin/outer membrane lipoprotein-sorting protein